MDVWVSGDAGARQRAEKEASETSVPRIALDAARKGHIYMVDIKQES